MVMIFVYSMYNKICENLIETFERPKLKCFCSTLRSLRAKQVRKRRIKKKRKKQDRRCNRLSTIIHRLRDELPMVDASFEG